MPSLVRKQYLYQVLRTGCVMCFIGHGAFGLITKAVWCNYFALLGIGPDLAYRLMPVVGSIDILMGLSLLMNPVRAVLLWLVIWGLVTASLRPLSGEPVPELIERAGNYLVPAALLVLCPPGISLGSWFRRIAGPAPGLYQVITVRRTLQVSVFLLLAGHAWLNMIGKPGLLGQYKSLGIADTILFARLAGSIELVLALVTLLHPFRSFLLVVLVWKMGSELFYPHYEILEWIERGGSYASIFGLWLCLGTSVRTRSESAFCGWSFGRETAGNA